MINNQIKKITIAGCGLMGTTIGYFFATHKYDVFLYDHSDSRILNARNEIENKLYRHGDLSKQDTNAPEKQALLSHIHFSTTKDCFSETDLVIEAITENMSAKHVFWKEISSIVSKDTILTTNTSGLSINEISESILNPTRFCGMHWINPPDIIALVEIIEGSNTSKETIAALVEFCRKNGKFPVHVKKDIPGFLLNRLQFSLFREAMHLVEIGAAEIDDIDNVLKYGLGPRYSCLGTFRVADLGGLDTYDTVANYLFPELCNAAATQEILTSLVREKHFGIKTGKGFYDYSNDEALSIIEQRDYMLLELFKCLLQNQRKNSEDVDL